MNQRDKWKKFIPVMAILAIAVILVLIVKISGEPLSVDTIVKYTPKNVVLAVIMLLLLFGLKELDDSSAAFYFISCQWNIVFAGGSCVH